MSKLRLAFLVFLVASGTAGLAAEPLVKSGERIVFFGDSITWLGGYTIPITSYLTLRYPELQVEFLRNAGLPGNTANDALKRLDRDVLDQKPTLVTVSFGINDCRAAPRDPQTVPEFLRATAQIVARLKDAGVRVVLLSPGCVDPAGTGNKTWYKTPEDCQAANTTLAQMTDELQHLAATQGVLFCDVYHPMLEAQQRLKAEQPGFTMIPDGLHPDDFGCCVMAAAILQTLGLERPAAALTIDAALGKTIADHCRVDALAIATNLVTFSRTDDSLPITTLNYPGYVRAMTTLATFPRYAAWNRYQFRITGLAPGKWQLAVSGAGNVASYTAEEWAAGVDLVSLVSPWVILAQQVNGFEGKLQQRRLALRERNRDLPNWVPPALLPEAETLCRNVEADINREAAHRLEVMNPPPTRQWTLRWVSK